MPRGRGAQAVTGAGGSLLCRAMSDTHELVPFEIFEPGVYLHGTKAQLQVGDLLMAGRSSNYQDGRVMNHIYFTATLDAAVWGAELAAGSAPERVYLVEPTGDFEDDPNVTDKKYPGNPTQSFRSAAPLRVLGELTDWDHHTPEQIQTMRKRLADLQRQGIADIDD